MHSLSEFEKWLKAQEYDGEQKARLRRYFLLNEQLTEIAESHGITPAEFSAEITRAANSYYFRDRTRLRVKPVREKLNLSRSEWARKREVTENHLSFKFKEWPEEKRKSFFAAMESWDVGEIFREASELRGTHSPFLCIYLLERGT